MYAKKVYNNLIPFQSNENMYLKISRHKLPVGWNKCKRLNINKYFRQKIKLTSQKAT